MPDLAPEAVEREHRSPGGHGRVWGEQREGKPHCGNPQQGKGTLRQCELIIWL